MVIKLIILDIDGVMTDGTKVYDLHGNVVSKRFNDKDFTAIKRFKSAGIHVCFLSGDRQVNEKIAERRNIPFYYSRTDKGLLKNAFVPILSNDFRVDAKEMAYVGDDIFDIPIMDLVGLSCCPEDAVQEVKNSCEVVLPVKGGDGVVNQLFRYFYLNNYVTTTNLEKLIALDHKEIP